MIVSFENKNYLLTTMAISIADPFKNLLKFFSIFTETANHRPSQKVIIPHFINQSTLFITQLK
jgi:predicted transcriptional regulator